MTPPDAARLLLLSIIWGASFLLMRIAAPEFGPVPLILVRATVAVALLGGVFFSATNRQLFRRHFPTFLFLGLINTALPFSLLAFSTLSLEVGFTSLLNATTPIFAAVIGALIFATPLRGLQVLGLFIAFGGVAILSWERLSFKPGAPGLAILAALGASAAYGLAVNFTKRRLAHIPPPLISAGSLLGSLFFLTIPGLLLWPEQSPSGKAWLCALLLAAVCTAVAYRVFFRLLTRGSAVATSSVTFLIPVFAILWGTTIGETIDARLILGMIVTLGGTALAIGLIGGRRR